ncbi:MAG: allene oxide cyclase family protein [Jatrophihabitantaceae bacterium]
MRRSTVVAGIALAAAVSVAGVTAAQAGTPGHPDSSSFTVVEHAVTDTVIDTGPAGDSVGDLLPFANPVFDAANRHQVGSDNGNCIRTVVGKAYECSWTLTLAGGSLVVSGPFYDAADSVLAVTGGTGRFRGASGQLKLHARDAAGSAYDFSYTLSH